MNRAVTRAVDIVEIVSRSPEGLTLSDLARTLGAPKSTVWSIVRALQDRGLLLLGVDRRTYRLGPKVAELGDRARRHPALQALARPFLVELGRVTGEAAFLSVVEREEVLYIDKVDSVQPIRYIADVGTRRPLHCTSVGKLYLSLLPESQAMEMVRRHGLTRYTRATITDAGRLKRELAATRARGYSVSREEFLEGVVGIAAPVLGARGQFLAALTVSVLVLRIAEREAEIAALVKEHAARLTMKHAVTRAPSPRPPARTPRSAPPRR